MATLWLTVPKYAKITETTTATVQALIKMGMVQAVKINEGGNYVCRYETDPAVEALTEELKTANKQIQKLCEHLGI